jgi:hypothetical protein
MKMKFQLSRLNTVVTMTALVLAAIAGTAPFF